MSLLTESPRPFVDAIYGEFLQRGVDYFLPGHPLHVAGICRERELAMTSRRRPDGVVEVEWLGIRYEVQGSAMQFTADEFRMLETIGMVLSTRYRLLQEEALAAQSAHLFRGQPEDRYVSAFLDPSPYTNPEALIRVTDRITEAIEVLRVSALTTYENRRVNAGVLLFGSHPDPCHAKPPLPSGALPYSIPLTAVRSFHRLSDGMQCLALVDQDGLLVELVDIQEWAKPFANIDLPVPSAALYQAHSRATLCGGHICLVLTPNGEIKVFAAGTQVFHFVDGRWRLTDAVEKYRRWEAAVGNAALAERLFTVALNLAELRRGGLFVIVDHPDSAKRLVSPIDLLNEPPRPVRDSLHSTKEQLHYLLRSRRVLDVAPAVLESVARIDGGIVLDRESRLLAFGAILHFDRSAADALQSVEGGRTTAALGASQYGPVLKISEDGLISFFEQGRCVWEM